MELQYHTSSGVLNAAPNLFTIQIALSHSRMMKPINPFILPSHLTFCVISYFAWCNIKMEKTKSLLINPLRIKQSHDGSIINYFILIELLLVHLLPLLPEQGCTNKADTHFIRSFADFSKRKIADIERKWSPENKSLWIFFFPLINMFIKYISKLCKVISKYIFIWSRKMRFCVPYSKVSFVCMCCLHLVPLHIKAYLVWKQVSACLIFFSQLLVSV